MTFISRVCENSPKPQSDLLRCECSSGWIHSLPCSHWLWVCISWPANVVQCHRRHPIGVHLPALAGGQSDGSRMPTKTHCKRWLSPCNMDLLHGTDRLCRKACIRISNSFTQSQMHCEHASSSMTICRKTCRLPFALIIMVWPAALL